MGAVIGYIMSAFIGLALVASLIWILGKWITRRNLSKNTISKGESTG
jgi:hypothetical protein